ncbi:Deoxyribose-phosphate aldolase 1 [Pirellulimonas nuda]|uniref:Deoxyribose-phosphate aldolase n=1 Tax=Pirellulimonas nuda TaxID=2528009 RepID=A0A518DET7_9BACT|nr:deoxyribose-phosphate aldolase [Pirellulimonas nuda]QDU89952.1 Deoxyribose-phosphate aldolase 1 [Pirellulimonas nuda]
MSQSLVSMIDHAVLHPTHGQAELRAACELCTRLGVASVCVKPSYVRLAAELLAGSDVVPSTVIGFPHGGTTTSVKVAETREACRAGAGEVDVVVNLGRVFSGDWDYVLADIRAVVEAAGELDAITKVIFETGLLPSDVEKTKLCELSERAGAAFVKTSTGFGMVKDAAGNLVATGATEHDIALMRRVCSPAVAVKASGGIRSLADAQRLVALGATRLGTSATQAIAAGERSDAAY